MILNREGILAILITHVNFYQNVLNKYLAARLSPAGGQDTIPPVYTALGLLTDIVRNLFALISGLNRCQFFRKVRYVEITQLWRIASR